MSGRVPAWVIVVLLSAGLVCMLGCGGKKQEGTPQTQLDSTEFPADTAVTDTAAAGSEKTLEDVEQYFDNKPKSGTASAAPGEFSESGRYAVQISASRFERASQRLVDKLKEQNVPAYLAEVENPTSDLIGTYYRVRVGYFTTVSAAKDYGSTLAGMGYDWWADNRSNDNVGGGSASAAPSSTPSTDAGFGGGTGYETSAPPPATETVPAATEPATTTPVDAGTGAAPATDWGGTTTESPGTGWE